MARPSDTGRTPSPATTDRSLPNTSATWDVYLGDNNNADTLVTAAADLLAINAGDNTWQYKPMDHTLAPFKGFSLGTVGNSNLSPNAFMGNVVDGIDFSILRGDVTTANLNNKLLVKDTATFVFSGATGFTESDISSQFAFGLGTAPDSLLPEPASIFLLATGAIAVLRRKRGI